MRNFESYSFYADRRTVKRTISEKSHSPRIRGQVSSDIARSFRAQIKRHHELKFTEILVYFF